MNVRIKVVRAVEFGPFCGGHYLASDDGWPIAFESVREALCFMAERNYTLPEICELDFEIEEA